MVSCQHMQISGQFESAYCSLCVAEAIHALGCDEVTARFALALHHGFETKRQ